MQVYLPRPGDEYGEYKLLDMLGAGGMGWVFSARHVLTGSCCAIKVLNVPTADIPPAEKERLLREAKAMEMLRHPNVVGFYDFGFNPKSGLPYIVMELVKGETLRAQLQKRRCFPQEEVLELAISLAGVLEFIHQKVAHRDLKPENIIVTENGPKLVDFGIARLLDSATRYTKTEIAATYPYISPERLQGDADDIGSDLFALGIICYELLVGDVPFPRQDSQYRDFLSQANWPDRFPPEFAGKIDKQLAQVIFTAIARTKAERYQQARDFRQALMKVKEAKSLGWSNEKLPPQLARARQPGFYVSQSDGMVLRYHEAAQCWMGLAEDQVEALLGEDKPPLSWEIRWRIRMGKLLRKKDILIEARDLLLAILDQEPDSIPARKALREVGKALLGKEVLIRRRPATPEGYEQATRAMGLSPGFARILEIYRPCTTMGCYLWLLVEDVAPGPCDYIVPEAQLLDFALKLAASLTEMHQLGLVHGHLAPSTISFQDGEVRILGTGLEGVVAPAYYPAEGPVGPAADVYALARIIVFFSCGQLPQQIPAEIPADLGKVLAQALARDPAKRFPDGEAFYHGLINLKQSHQLRQREVDRWARKLAQDAKDLSPLKRLIAALSDSSPPVRQRAIAVLSRWVGQDFGYQPHASRQEREIAIKRWWDWLSQKAHVGWYGEKMPQGMRLGREPGEYIWRGATACESVMVYVPAGEFWRGSSDDEIQALLWEDPDFKAEWIEDEKPLTKLYLPGYYIDKYEVTNEQYAHFIDSHDYAHCIQLVLKTYDARTQVMLEKQHNLNYLVTITEDIDYDHTIPYNDVEELYEILLAGPQWWHRPGHIPRAWYQPDQHHIPVIGVCWYEAMAFALWSGRRLPRENEWEKSARGGLQIPNWQKEGVPLQPMTNPFARRSYPWGPKWDRTKANSSAYWAGEDLPTMTAWEERFRMRGLWLNRLPLTPVGSFPAGQSPYKCLDMAGNVWEWTSDIYDRIHNTKGTAKDSKAMGKQAAHNQCRFFICRGGSWYNQPKYLRTAFRHGYLPSTRHDGLGFRTVVETG